MKLHPSVEGLYRAELAIATSGNGLSGGNCITAALARAVEMAHKYPRQPEHADLWERTAVNYAVRAAHAIHQLGLIQRLADDAPEPPTLFEYWMATDQRRTEALSLTQQATATEFK